MIRTCFITFMLTVQTFAADFDSLYGKVLCGYQGWFRVPEDGTGLGWFHYGSRGQFAPGDCTIDLWPDVRELPEPDRFETPFRFDDGSVAEVFSSVRPDTVSMHFQWMQEYGIDGIFLQRFAVTARDPRHLPSMDAVLSNCLNSARATDRAVVVMYDLSGLRPGQSDSVINDWKQIQEKFAVTDRSKHPTYLHHRGKPLMALWGLGFSDRAPMLDEWEKLIDYFKQGAVDGGCTVMVGVPTFWRSQTRDAIDDPKLHELLASVDVISPWTIGRHRTPDEAVRYARETMADDLEWCRDRNIDFLPVAFPGFSWHNLSKARGQTAPLNQIPRRGGEFFWSQSVAFRDAGAKSLYVAMFDELDEATAIFKVRNDPPVGESPFVSEPGLPTDHYLWLTGQAGRLFRGELKPIGNQLPERGE